MLREYCILGLGLGRVSDMDLSASVEVLLMEHSQYARALGVEGHSGPETMHNGRGPPDGRP